MICIVSVATIFLLSDNIRTSGRLRYATELEQPASESFRSDAALNQVSEDDLPLSELVPKPVAKTLQHDVFADAVSLRTKI